MKFMMRCFSTVCSPSQFFQSKGWCGNPTKPRTKGQVCSLAPDEVTPFHQATKPPAFYVMLPGKMGPSTANQKWGDSGT